MAAMRVPVWLKILWTVWVVVWAPLYWKYYGAQNLLYFCDLGNFFISAALWLESPLLFSSQASGLLLFQSLYTIDLLGAALSGRHLIGGTEFMFDSTVPLPVRLLSLFHLVTGSIRLSPPGWWCPSIISGGRSMMSTGLADHCFASNTSCRDGCICWPI